MRQRSMKRRQVIALDNIVPAERGGVTYFAAKVQSDGAWHTPDINKAKIWRHPGVAMSVIYNHGDAWASYNPRVLDARTVPGYVDKPNATDKRRAAAERRLKVTLDRYAPRPPTPSPAPFDPSVLGPRLARRIREDLIHHFGGVPSLFRLVSPIYATVVGDEIGHKAKHDICGDDLPVEWSWSRLFEVTVKIDGKTFTCP